MILSKSNFSFCYWVYLELVEILKLLILEDIAILVSWVT